MLFYVINYVSHCLHLLVAGSVIFALIKMGRASQGSASCAKRPSPSVKQSPPLSDSALAVSSVSATEPLSICKPKMHPGSIVLDVVGISSGDHGCHCEVHKNTLPMNVL